MGSSKTAARGIERLRGVPMYMYINMNIGAGHEDTVYSLISHAAARNPGATAITFLPMLDAEPERITYGAFLARLHQTARLFRELGVARNDVLTLLVSPIPDAVVALWAADAVGIAHPVNTLLRAEAISAMMRAANSRLLVVTRPQLG